MSASQTNRITGKGLIDRRKPLRFTFDGKSYDGFQGDTLASALLANGVVLTGRSFKYHRARGILSAGSEEPNAIVELRTGARREPNTRATMIELFPGLEAHSQNRWPSLKYDVLSINSLLSPVFVAGFYYKTFMWPSAMWEKLYEPMIRRAAGLGRASDEADPDTYDKSNAFCDVLVVGGGAAGLMAALAAGRTGARVILCDEHFDLGGRLLSETQLIDGKPAPGLDVEVIPDGIRYRQQQNEIKTTSDKDGLISVTWPAAGRYWLHSDTEDDKTSVAAASKRRLSYSLTLEVLPQ